MLYVILIPMSDFEDRKMEQPYPLLQNAALRDRKMIVLVDGVVSSADGPNGIAMLSKLQTRLHKP